MKKYIALILSVLMVIGLLGGCGGGAEDEALSKESLIGIVLPTKEESYWLNCQKFLEENFAGYNYEILYSQGNSATEKTNVETFISKGAKILIYCAFDAEAAAATAEMAKEEGLTVMLRPSDHEHRCHRLLRNLRQPRSRQSPGQVSDRAGR